MVSSVGAAAGVVTVSGGGRPERDQARGRRRRRDQGGIGDDGEVLLQTKW